MDSKEIKLLLKQAREAIREKEYKAALKHCKAILKLDKNNYNGWVFIGVAAQEMEQLAQAEAAFNKAIEIAPNQILAWQGLCNLYEKNYCEEYREKLIKPYVNMIKHFEGEKIKQLDVAKKLEEIYKLLGQKEKYLDILKSRVQFSEGIPLEEYNSWLAIRNFLDQKLEHSNEELVLLQQAYSELVSSTADTSMEEKKKMFEQYLHFLIKQNHNDEIISQTKVYMERVPESLMPLECLCRLAAEHYIEKSIIIEGTEGIAQCLKEKGGSAMADIALGIVLFSRKLYIEAITAYKSGLNQSPSIPEGLLLLSKAYLEIYRYEEAKLNAMAGLKQTLVQNILSTIPIRGLLYLCLAEALAGQHLWAQAMQSLNKASEKLGKIPRVLKILINISLKTGQVERAEEICQELRVLLGDCAVVLQLEGAILIAKQKYSEAEEKLRKAINLTTSSLSLHLLGTLYWETSRSNESINVFMQAAKLDPYYSRNFLYMGHYYMTCHKDSMKALRCYKKSYELDIYDDEAGAAFSDTLRDLGDDDTNFMLLKKTTAESPVGCAKWARIRLGLYYLQHENTSAAIDALQGALHCDPLDSHCWETVGDAYLQRGSYDSALKSFERATELNPANLHSCYWMGHILLTTGNFMQAAHKYRNILESEPNYIPALKGLSEALIYQAKCYFNECRFGRFSKYCEDAVLILSRAVSLQPRLSCLWKLLGDTFTLLYNLDSQFFPFSVPKELVNKTSGSVILEKYQMLEFGGRFYTQAISLQSDISGLWHDLGVNYFYQSRCFATTENNKARKLAEKSLLCLQKAVSLEPNCCEHWTALGVVSSYSELKSYTLSQHAFIKSIQCESNNAGAWTNLGVLYLIHNKIQLAHQAFKEAQKIDPSYPICWIGQALVAESVEHSETLDLFRHSSVLGNHPECLLGYGHWICKMLQDCTNRGDQWYKENIEETNAISAALDCLVKYTANKSDCWVAYNMLGIMLERKHLYREALIAFERSVTLHLRNKMKLTLDKAIINYARLLTLNHKPKEAIASYLSIENQDASYFCGLAIAYHQAQDFDKSDQAFQQAFQLASSNKEKSCILVGRALMARKSKGPEVTKSLLFESSKLAPCVEGQLALISLAILQENCELASTTMNSLHSHKPNTEHLPFISYINSCYHAMKGCSKLSKAELCKTIHMYPENPKLWSYLAMVLLHFNKGLISVILKCVKMSIFHTNSMPPTSTLLFFCHLIAGDINLSLREAQKLLHIRPDLASNWLLLIAACYGTGDTTNVKSLYNFVYSAVKCNNDLKSREITIWLLMQKTIFHLDQNDVNSAKSSLNLLFKEAGNNDSHVEFIRILSLALGSQKESITKHLRNLKDISRHIPQFLWGILQLVKMKSACKEDIVEFLRDLLANKVYPSSPLLHALLALAAYSKLKEERSQKEKLGTLCQANITEGLKLSPTCQALHFTQGLLAKETDNLRLQRKCLERVLENKIGTETLWMECIARQLLLKIYWDKNDSSAIEWLMTSAKEAHDETTLQKYADVTT